MAKTAAERQRDYRKRHPARMNNAKSKWALEKPEKFREGVRRRNRAYEKRNPGRSITRNAKFRTTIHGAACYLYWNAKRRAKVENVEFSITKEWIKSVLESGKCQITGLSFAFGNGRRPWMPSLDRLNSKLGYTINNVQIVVWLYNAAKAEFSHEDVMTLAKALISKQKGGGL